MQGTAQRTMPTIGTVPGRMLKFSYYPTPWPVRVQADRTLNQPLLKGLKSHKTNEPESVKAPRALFEMRMKAHTCAREGAKGSVMVPRLKARAYKREGM